MNRVFSYAFKRVFVLFSWTTVVSFYFPTSLDNICVSCGA